MTETTLIEESENSKDTFVVDWDRNRASNTDDVEEPAVPVDDLRWSILKTNLLNAYKECRTKARYGGSRTRQSNVTRATTLQAVLGLMGVKAVETVVETPNPVQGWPDYEYSYRLEDLPEAKRWHTR